MLHRKFESNARIISRVLNGSDFFLASTCTEPEYWKNSDLSRWFGWYCQNITGMGILALFIRTHLNSCKPTRQIQITSTKPSGVSRFPHSDSNNFSVRVWSSIRIANSDKQRPNHRNSLQKIAFVTCNQQTST